MNQRDTKGIVYTRKAACDLALLALCIWREGRGEPYEGQVAIGWTIRNRVNKPNWWGKDYASVILHRYQISSFNAGEPGQKFPNPELTHDTDSWESCLSAAEQVYLGWDGQAGDPTNGATHYYSSAAMQVPPTWVNAGGTEFKVQIGNHRFYTAK